MSKIAYIGHSFHEKTGSTVFFIDLLKKQFDVEIIPNYSWATGDLPDLSHLDESYIAVVIFELISEDLLSAIPTRNIVYIPMVDYIINGIDSNKPELFSFRPYSFWEMLAKRGVKIINFSACLQRLCINMGIQSLYVQYFPPPTETPEFGGELSVFYWERSDSISPEIVNTLIGSSIRTIHHHCAPDPGQCKSAMYRKDNGFISMSLTTSTWFADKDEYLRCVEGKSIYIAPRPFEGIGMSFLEAMSMGKAVVAADYPTMNEYIRNGYNGYLFDIQRPKAIDFAKIEEVRRNAYESVVSGRKRWINQSEEIIEWIIKPIEERRRASFINVYRDLGLSPSDCPKINVRTLKVAEPVPESADYVQQSEKGKAKKGFIRRALRFIANITLRELVSPKVTIQVG